MGADDKALEGYLDKFISIVREVTKVNTQMLSNQRELRGLVSELKISHEQREGSWGKAASRIKDIKELVESHDETVKLVAILMDPNKEESLTNILREIKAAELAKTVVKLRYAIWTVGIVWTVVIGLFSLLFGLGILGGR